MLPAGLVTWRRSRGSIITPSLAMAALIIHYFSNNDALKGTWNFDGTTIYRFNGDGTGALILPSAEYDFAYTITKKDKTVAIDFEDGAVVDRSYAYRLEGDKLTLTANDGKTAGTFEFEKVKEKN